MVQSGDKYFQYGGDMRHTWTTDAREAHVWLDKEVAERVAVAVAGITGRDCGVIDDG